MALGAQDGGPLYIQPPELAAQLSALQLQENNLRFLQYTQSQAFAQQQALHHHAQRMQGTAPQSQSSTERSRTNSFDTAPLSAPMRPDMRPEMYYYQVPLQPFYSFAAYPSIPSNVASADYRRSSHRSTTASDAGLGSPGSTIRSQSQPASRPIAVVAAAQNFAIPAHMPNGFTSVPARHVNGIPIPSFIPDEGNDNEQGSPATNSPDDGKSSSYYTNPSSPRRTSVTINGMPAFGDIGSHSEGAARRRLSSEGFAQYVPDSTVLRSRSPSPSNQEMVYSRSQFSAPLVAAPLSPKQSTRETAPLVVNGSKSRPLPNSSPRQVWHVETMVSDPTWYENPLQIHQDPNSTTAQPASAPDKLTTSRKDSSPVPDRPMVVNGSRPTPTPSPVTPPHPGSHFTTDAVTLNPEGVLNVTTWPTGTVPMGNALPSGRLPTTLQRFPRPIPSPLIAQLDLATENNVQANDLHHLSPVYETKSPSPNFTRKLKLPPNDNSVRTVHASQKRREATLEFSRTKPKSLNESPTTEAEVSSNTNPRINGLMRENGHVRGAKSESDNTWQKPRGRKRVHDLKGRSEVFTQSEQPPKNDADRKGG
jgi:hypothetical protein